MVISQATEYTIRAMVYMTAFPLEQAVSKRDICKTQGVTPAFLVKIMQPLIAIGLVKSYRGIAGGFSLGKPPEEISLLDIILAEEGPIYLNKCMTREGYCSRDATCPVHTIWNKAKRELDGTLSQTTLAHLAQKMKESAR